MKTAWIFTFFLVLSAEVKLKASGFDEPRVLSSRDGIIDGSRILQGSHWIRRPGRKLYQTPYGNLEASKSADFYVSFEKQRVYVVNHKGVLKVRLKDESVVDIPPGFEFWFSEIQDNRKNKMGLISPVDMSSYVEKLREVWNGKFPEFKKEVVSLHRSWGDRVQMASQFYKRLVERKLASAEEVRRQEEFKKGQRRAQRDEHRKLLFERVFNR